MCLGGRELRGDRRVNEGRRDDRGEHSKLNRSLKSPENRIFGHLHFHPEDFHSLYRPVETTPTSNHLGPGLKKKHNVLAATPKTAAQQGNAGQIFHTNDSFPGSQTRKATSTSLILRIESQNTTKDRSDCDLKTTLVTTSGPI